MHMVRHQMTFQNFYTFIFAKQLNNFTQALSVLIVNDFSSILRRENNVIFTYPFCMWKTICLISHKNTPSMKQYNLNTYIILEGAFLRLTLWLHPHSGWFFVSRALARSTGSRPYKKTEQITLFGLKFKLKISDGFLWYVQLCRNGRACSRVSLCELYLGERVWC